jgi:putative flippase GtrA
MLRGFMNDECAMIKQFIRFCLIGGTGLATILALTHVGVQLLHLWYFSAYLIATLVGWSIIFLFNTLWTFPDAKHPRHPGHYLAFLAGYVGIFCMNASLVYILTSLFGIHYLVSITFASGVGTIFSFLFNKHVIFRS